MRRIKGIIILLIFVALVSSVFWNYICDFILWLVMINYSSPNISFVGGLVARILTFAVSFGIVGIIFNLINYHNKNLMSGSYLIVSIIVGFVINMIIWFFEKYINIILIVIGSILVLIMVLFTVRYLLQKRGEAS